MSVRSDSLGNRTSAEADRLRRVIAERAVRPVFQPIAHLPTQTIAGHEALTRVDPSTGFSNPGELFDAAERHGMLWELEQVTRRVSLEACAAWPPGVMLFLNATPTVVADPRFPAQLEADIARVEGVTPNRIVIEITERSPDALTSALQTNARAIQQMGCQTAIDDVGAGTSGLNRIMRLQPNWLKLDRELIDGLDHEPTQQNLIRFILHFARLSGVSLIGEGVERDEELQTLIELGVPFAQGYLIARPAEREAAMHVEARAVIEEAMQRGERLRYQDPRAQRLCDLAKPVPQTEQTTPIRAAAEMVAAETGVRGVVVLDVARVMGWCGRRTLLERAASNASNDPIASIARMPPSVMETSTTIIEALQFAASRPEHLSDLPLLLVERGACTGVVTPRDLLHIAARICEGAEQRMSQITGLPGRVLCERSFVQAIERRRRATSPGPDLGFIDLHDFAECNALFGFEIGDQIIRSTAGVILGTLETVTNPRSQVFHLRGDRFCVVARTGVLPEISKQLVDGVIREISSWTGHAARRRGIDLHGEFAILRPRVIGLEDAFVGQRTPRDLFRAETALRAQTSGVGDQLSTIHWVAPADQPHADPASRAA